MESEQKQNNGGKFLIILILIVAAVLILCEILPGIISDIKTKSAYRNAEELIDAEEYAKARDLLRSITVTYLDSDGLEALCEAHICADKGDYSLAYAYLYPVTFHHQSSAQMQKINRFKSNMEQEFYREVDRETVEESESTADTEKRKPANNGQGQNAKKPKPDEDPFGASDYLHPDDFYYDHFDDFVDFEEAEEYFEKYH